MPVALLLAVLSSLTTEGRTVALLSPPAPHQVLLAQADAPPAGASASELRDYYRKRAAEPKAEGAPSAPPVVSAPHAVAAQPSVQYEVIRTKDGLVYTGQTVREMEKGILFRGADGETTLIEYGNIADMQRPGAPTARTSSAGNTSRLELEHRLFALKQERAGMVSPWVGLALTAGGGIIFWFTSIVVGVVFIASGVGVLAFAWAVASGLDAEIRQTDAALKALPPQGTAPSLIPPGRGLVLARF